MLRVQIAFDYLDCVTGDALVLAGRQAGDRGRSAGTGMDISARYGGSLEPRPGPLQCFSTDTAGAQGVMAGLHHALVQLQRLGHEQHGSSTTQAVDFTALSGSLLTAKAGVEPGNDQGLMAA